MSELQFSQRKFIRTCHELKDFTNTPDKKFEPGAEGFLRNFYRDANESGFSHYDLEQLCDLARAFWMFPDIRLPGESLIDAEPLSSFSPLNADKGEFVIKIAVDDMSFLVDSVVAAISSFGISVTGLFHPIVSGYREKTGKWREQEGKAVAESMILVTTPHLNRKTKSALIKELKATLRDVYIINNDFKGLLKNIQSVAEDLSKLPGAADD